MRVLTILPILLARYALATPTPSTELQARDWPKVTAFTSRVAKILPVGMSMRTVCKTLTMGSRALSITFGIPTSESNGCGDITVLHARGTCEVGNNGLLVGPWLSRLLSVKAKPTGLSVGFNGFAYPATVADYLSGTPRNGLRFAKTINETLAQCPETKLILAGYSQGGIVVHHAAANLDADTMDKVSSVVIFGHPYSKQPVPNIDQSKVKIFCHEGDNICDNGPITTLAHFNYAEDAEAAADLIMSQVEDRSV